MVWEGSPNLVWDDALEFKAYVRSNTSLDIYMLQGEVPEDVMLGGTSDICQFCEHGFYNWVMFRDKPIQYADKHTVLGKYLGTIDVGTEMKAKFMNRDGKVVHRST